MKRKISFNKWYKEVNNDEIRKEFILRDYFESHPEYNEETGKLEEEMGVQE